MLCMAEIQFKQMWKESPEAKYFCRQHYDTSLKPKRRTASFKTKTWSLPTQDFLMLQTQNKEDRVLFADTYALMIH